MPERDGLVKVRRGDGEALSSRLSAISRISGERRKLSAVGSQRSAGSAGGCGSSQRHRRGQRGRVDRGGQVEGPAVSLAGAKRPVASPTPFIGAGFPSASFGQGDACETPPSFVWPVLYGHREPSRAAASRCLRAISPALLEIGLIVPGWKT